MKNLQTSSRRYASFACLACVAALGLASAAQAASSFNFSAIPTGTVDTAEWNWNGSELRIKNNANITISGAANNRGIRVQANAKATITFTTLVLQDQSGNAPPLALDDGANVTLNLQGASSLMAGGSFPGILAPAGTTLAINGPGSVTANGGSGAAGIGGGGNIGNHDGGAITLNSGTTEATGSAGGAGIGGGSLGSGGVIVIHGGTVRATGNGGGAGIGGGFGGVNGSAITIDGGAVTAKSVQGGAGIGSGQSLIAQLPAGVIKIDFSKGATVTASGGPGSGSTGNGAAVGQGGAGGSNAASGWPGAFTHPASVTVTAGGTATFGCAASTLGSATLVWSWLRGSGNGVTIAGASVSGYSFVTNASMSGEQYRCVATLGNVGAGSSITLISRLATLTVTPPLPPPPLPSQISLSPQTLTGLWNDPAYNGSGFTTTMTPSGLIVYYYGWDNAGHRLWLISENGPTSILSGTPITLPMRKTSGGTFLAPADPADPGVMSIWGALTIEFAADGGTASATLAGDDGAVNLDLAKFAGMSSPGAFTGLWYDLVYSGSGFVGTVTPAGLVLYYYGWDNDGHRLWLISGNGPTTVTPGDLIALPMQQTSGGTFLKPADPNDPGVLSVWGSLQITYTSCDHATAKLVGNDSVTTVNLNVDVLARVLGRAC
jgi:hypothetical protein